MKSATTISQILVIYSNNGTHWFVGVGATEYRLPVKILERSKI